MIQTVKHDSLIDFTPKNLKDDSNHELHLKKKAKKRFMILIWFLIRPFTTRSPRSASRGATIPDVSAPPGGPC